MLQAETCDQEHRTLSYPILTTNYYYAPIPKKVKILLKARAGMKGGRGEVGVGGIG